MNRIQLVVFLLISFFTTTALQATVHRVNNTGADADFTTAQAAHDGANAGDTLYIESSNTSYGNLVISKEIHIIGAGYFLTQNIDLQASVSPSIIGTLTISVGSDFSSVQGMTIQYVSHTTGSNSADISDITVERCYIYGGIYLHTNNDLHNFYFMNNYIVGTNSTYRSFYTNGSGNKNITLLNNIFGYSNTWSSILLDANTECTLKNNVFELQSITSTFCTFKNNIYVNTGSLGNVANNSFFNNICSGTQFPAGNANQQNVSMSTVFLGYPNQGSYSSDGRYQLSGSSPAIGAGEGGTDCGPFGGDVPYVLSGIPSIPTIYKLIAPSAVSGNFNVTISTRSNN